MSTRSGKRIHTSLLEDTAVTKHEPVAKSERKTRSKRAKENSDELSVSLFKNKKRNNYVSYPTDDELPGETATIKESKTENALKEQNPVKNSDQLEPQKEEKSVTRKSRRGKRADDAAEETEDHENVPVEITKLPKSKKSKKKKEVEAIIVNSPTAEEPAKKSKKRKKKGKRTSSTIVEDVTQNDDSKNMLFNISNMSVDSFHSAAGSPHRNKNIDTVQVNKADNTFEKTEEINKSSSKNNRKVNKKNSKKNTIDKNDISGNMSMDKVGENKDVKKITKNKKSVSKVMALDQCYVSVAKDNLEKGLENILNLSNLSNGQLKKRNSKKRDRTFDQIDILTNFDIDKDAESDINVPNTPNRQGKRRKSNIEVISLSENISEDVDYTKVNDTFDQGLRQRNSAVKNVTFDKSNASIGKETVDIELNTSNISNKHRNTRGSMLKDSTFDKSNASIAKEIVDSNVDIDINVSNISNTHSKTRRSMLKDSTFDKSNASIAKEIVDSNVDIDINVSNISNTHSKTRRSMLKDSTFDKSNASIAKEIVDSNVDIDINVSNISNTHSKTRRSMLKDSTFDKSNASIAKEDQEVDLNVSKKHSKARKSILKDSTFNKSNASVTNDNIVLKDTEPDLNASFISNKQRRSSKANVKDSTFDKQDILNTTFEKGSEKDKESKKDSTFNKSDSKQLDATYERDLVSDTSKRKEKRFSGNTTCYETECKTETTFEKDMSTSFDTFKKGAMTRKSSIKDASFDKSNSSVASSTNEHFDEDNIIINPATKRRSIRHTFDKNDTILENVNTTYEKTGTTDNELKRKSPRLSKPVDIQIVLNATFEKDDTEEQKDNLFSGSKSSLISSDNSSVADKTDLSRISITSDDTSEHIENIVNTTPLLIESSIDESHVSITKPDDPKPQTPLKREGTFTKDSPELQTEVQVETPTKRKSIPTAGCTPYHVTKSSQKKSMLNVTRSLEKGAPATVDPVPRLTRVMFCSPVDNPLMFTQEKRKIIKSNLKGSNKSFVFDDSVSVSRPGRKRSFTQSDADDARVKRTRLAEDLQHSVDRLSRPRTASATAKLSVTTPKKSATPSKSKSEGKPSRTKLPNFAAMHQKQFDKMESLDECQERRAKRAKQLLTPTAPPGLLDRISPKNNPEPIKVKETAKPKEKTDTPTKKLPTLESLRPGFTRFGFKLNLDVNPFSIPSKTVEKPKEKPVLKPNGILPRRGILPSLAGATSVRREVAKLTVMREKSFTDKRNVKRNENRTVIKGVRTNRRFELQMKMRNMD